MPPVVTFSGPDKVITAIDTGGDHVIPVDEIYSEWKEWVQASDNAKFEQAFAVVGGDPITATESLGSTFFLENGWRIRPAERSHKITLVGNIFTREEGQSVFTPTLGTFNVSEEVRVSSLVSTVATGGGGGLTASQETALLSARDNARAANAQTQQP